MARRQSRTVESYLITAMVIIAVAIGSYLAPIEIIEYTVRQQMESIQAVLRQPQADQLGQHELAQQREIVATHAAQLANQQLEAEERVREAAQRARDQASSYLEPRGCDNWRTDAQMVRCLTDKTTARGAFDR
jgi:hypothetical protein